MKWLFFFIPKEKIEKKDKRTLSKKELTRKQQNFIARKKKK
jgi:hypothetical protein